MLFPNPAADTPHLARRIGLYQNPTTARTYTLCNEIHDRDKQGHVKPQFYCVKSNCIIRTKGVPDADEPRKRMLTFSCVFTYKFVCGVTTKTIDQF
jgi:hypothetical protein